MQDGSNSKIESQKHLYRNYGFMNSRGKVIMFTPEKEPRFLVFWRNTNGHEGFEFLNEGVEPQDIYIPSKLPSSEIGGIANISDLSRIGNYKGSGKSSGQNAKRESQLEEEIITGTRRNVTKRGIEEELLSSLPYRKKHGTIVFGSFAISYDSGLPPVKWPLSDGKEYTIYTSLAMVKPEYLVGEEGKATSVIKLLKNDEHETVQLMRLDETIDALKTKPFKKSGDDLAALGFAFDRNMSENILRIYYPRLQMEFHKIMAGI